MTAKPVQSVFFWRADGTSVFKAIYGRLGNKGGYTKDFHQPRGEQARALERALGTQEGVEVDFEWRWPGGSDPHGKLHPAADFATSNGRMNLRWSTNAAPLPWRLRQDASENTIETLIGQPGLTDPDEADKQLEALRAQSEEPWLVAVHLHGEGAVLHARTVLGNPRPGRERASWNSLPAVVRQAMKDLPASRPSGYVEFEEGFAVRAGAIVDRVMTAFRDTPNVLLVGPPGTGKTVAMDDVRRAFEESGGVGFDPDRLHGAFDEATEDFAGETRVRSVVFHPSFTYEDFVMGLLPEPTDTGVTVKPHVGPLLELAHFASAADRRALLIADEFNRGAAASIFGDTLALLDVDKRAIPGDTDSGAKIRTPYAHLGPKTPSGEALADETGLPSSLYILAAMNSADRSVAPLDAALRRRFAILYIGPDYDVLRDHLGVPEDFDLGEPDTWTTPDHIRVLAVRVLENLNSRIEAVSGRDFLLGQSVMWKVGGEDRSTALRSLAAAMDNNVIGTLTLSFTDRDGEFAAVLNVNQFDESRDPRHPTGAAEWQAPDEAIKQVATPRLRPVRFQRLSDDDLVSVFASLL
jgi:5-methylcytosine-specific restriction protein B